MMSNLTTLAGGAPLRSEISSIVPTLGASNTWKKQGNGGWWVAAACDGMSVRQEGSLE
jgi:hypothetical protein